METGITARSSALASCQLVWVPWPCSRRLSIGDCRWLCFLGRKQNTDIPYAALGLAYGSSRVSYEYKVGCRGLRLVWGRVRVGMRQVKSWYKLGMVGSRLGKLLQVSLRLKVGTKYASKLIASFSPNFPVSPATPDSYARRQSEVSPGSHSASARAVVTACWFAAPARGLDGWFPCLG